MKEIRIGLIGAGYMGRSHSAAYCNVRSVFGDEPAMPRLELIADLDPASAKSVCENFGFRGWTGNWEDVIANGDIDVVDICAPNGLHREIAIAAMRAGKHVYCEKPLALTSAESLEMARAAKQAGVITLVGFNYTKNPVQAYVKRLLDTGEIGDVVQFRGARDQDIMNDPELPFSWRHEVAIAGSGALGDNGVHALSVSQMLMGDIVEVCGVTGTFITERPVASGGSGYAARVAEQRVMRRVENDDVVIILAKYASGALGSIESSRIGTGRKAGPIYEIHGTRGTIQYDQQRLNEVQVFRAGKANGFVTVRMGNDHPGYSGFYPEAGMQIGFNDQKVVEVRDLIVAIATGKPTQPDFIFGHKVCLAVDAVLRSASEKRWVSLAEIERGLQ